MEFRLGDYVMDLPEGIRLVPYVMAPKTLAEHDGRHWKFALGLDTWHIALRPGGTLDDLSNDVLIQTRLEIEPDVVSINGIPGVRHAAQHDDLTRVAWHFLQGKDLITFNLFARQYITRAEAESRGAWMKSLRYHPA